jgi:hypothetical protein
LRVKVLFRKRTSVNDFARRLIELHAGLFGRETLLEIADKLQISLTDARFATALSEWLFFAAFVVRQCVSTKCGENAALRNAILDAFFGQMYVGLLKAGVQESDMPHVEGCIKARFEEYERAQLHSRGGGPISELGIDVATLMFGEGVEAVRFAPVPVLRFSDSLEFVKKLFDDYKIVN